MLLNRLYAYAWVWIALHWLMALAFLAMFVLDRYRGDLDYQDACYHGAAEIQKVVASLNNPENKNATFEVAFLRESVETVIYQRSGW